MNHDKMTRLDNDCVTMNEFMDTFYERNDLSDVIFEYCSKLSCKIIKASFEKQQSVLKLPINPRIFLQRSEHNFE